MFLALVPWLLKRGFGEKAAKLISGGIISLLIVGALVGALWLWGNSRYHAGVLAERNRTALAVAQANQRFLEQKARADELAANQRLTDTIAVNRQEQELRDAIASTPDTAPDAVRIRLGCERLRRAAGSHPADLPPACRSGG